MSGSFYISFRNIRILFFLGIQKFLIGLLNFLFMYNISYNKNQSIKRTYNTIFNHKISSNISIIFNI